MRSQQFKPSDVYQEKITEESPGTTDIQGEVDRLSEMLAKNHSFLAVGLSELPTATDELLIIMVERDQALATLRRLHAAANIVTAYEWPQDASPMGAMDEFDAAMAEAEKMLKEHGRL